MEEKRELVFVPAPALGHVAPTVELAKRLVSRDHPHHRISITILNIKAPSADPHIDAYIESLSSIFPDITFIDLPHLDRTSPPISDAHVAVETFASLLMDTCKVYVKDAITQLISSKPIRLAGLVIDILFTALIDVANEFQIPTYLYLTTNASILGLMLHLPILDAQSEFNDTETELNIPSFADSVPLSVLPSPVFNKRDDIEAYKWYVYHCRRFGELKGILVNTFGELEPNALDSLAGGGSPRVYAVGPVLDVEGKVQFRSDRAEQERIMKWLDGQPPCSVLLLCFGSLGAFSPEQVREIAVGLERSGHRFLWSLRNPIAVGTNRTVVAGNPREGLPEGFERRMEGRGMVCEWVPQVEALGHEAIGGFVSHCGWNSILESLWFGVPIATWPMHTEQQLNAFLMVREKKGLAVEMRLEYRMDGGDVVTAEEVERGVRKVMDKQSEVRRRVREMRDKSRDAVMDGGSSFASLGQFIDDLIDQDSIGGDNN